MWISFFSHLKSMVMKNFYLVAVFLLLSTQARLIGQGDVNYIVCEAYEETGNTISVFDWRADFFDMYMEGRPGLDQVVSPFFLSSSAGQPNTTFLVSPPRDFEPTDGWELVFKDFGKPDSKVETPTLVLYNRFSGVLRVFQYAKIDIETFVGATVSIAHLTDNDVFKNNSGVFGHMNTPMHALEDFEKDIAVDFPNRYQNYVLGSANRTWLFGEVLTAYDPCVCSFENLFQIKPHFLDLQSIQLNISGTSTTEAFSPTTGIASSPFNSALKASSSVIDALTTGGKTYKELGYFEDFLDGVFGLSSDDAGPLLSIGADLVGAIPYIGTAIKLLDKIVGVVRPAGSNNTGQISTFNSTYTFEADGALQKNIPGSLTFIKVPGGKDIANLFASNQEQTVYDNPLGVLTLLETPLVYRARTETYVEPCEDDLINDPYCWDEFTYYSYKFSKDNFLYAVNNAAGISLDP